MLGGRGVLAWRRVAGCGGLTIRVQIRGLFFVRIAVLVVRGVGGG
jgi:hypothetical protein